MFDVNWGDFPELEKLGVKFSFNLAEGLDLSTVKQVSMDIPFVSVIFLIKLENFV